MERWDTIQEGVDSLPQAILLGLISSYDSLFQELYKNLLLLRPERYNDSNKQLTAGNILKLNSFEEVIEMIISDEIDGISSKPHHDQIDAFEKSFSIDVRGRFKDWAEVIEVFERRNLAAHGALVVDMTYLDNCKKHGLDTANIKCGDVLKVDRKYLLNSVDVLVDLGTRLVFAAWHKQVTDERVKAFNAVVLSTYNMIKVGRFRLAENISAYICENFSKGAPDSDIKALTVNQAIAMKKQNKSDQCAALLEKTDWSASAPIYKICVSSILEDIDESVSLLPTIKATKELSVTEFREWPAFDWVRNNETFKAAFKKVFKMSLYNEVREETISRDTARD